MNSEQPVNVNAYNARVAIETEDIFDDAFFQKQSLVLNALDNVASRKYVDLRCLNTRIPLIDSGTLGSKAHVQVKSLFSSNLLDIIPFLGDITLLD